MPVLEKHYFIGYSFLIVLTYCRVRTTCCKFDIFFITVPTPSVTVTASNTQIVGQSLTLESSVTAVRGITSRVDIIWRRNNNMMLRRTNNTTPTMMNNSLVYTNNYTITLLSTDNEDRGYYCEVVINASPVVIATGNTRLDVTGE